MNNPRGIWLGHAHNFPLEVAVSHGLLVSTLFVGVVLALLITALKLGVLTISNKPSYSLRTSIFDRAWWTSSLILVLLHTVDMPLFDSRINIAGWVLLSGVRCIIISLNSNKNLEYKS